MKREYSVWAEGQEITDSYVTKEEANMIADIWIEQGYANVEIEHIEGLAK